MLQGSHERSYPYNFFVSIVRNTSSPEIRTHYAALQKRHLKKTVVNQPTKATKAGPSPVGCYKNARNLKQVIF